MSNSLFPELDRPYELGWDGTPMRGTLESPIAFDTETFAVDEAGAKLDLRLGPPRMVLATVSDGKTNLVLHPDQVASWLLAHKDQHLVGHNFAFDFWVVLRELERQRDHWKVADRVAHALATEGKVFTEELQDQCERAIAAWWQMGDRGQFHDTMLLDLLVMLAEGKNDDGSDKLEPRNLGQLARQYCPKIKVNKEDPFRLRYHEIAAVPFAQWGEDVDPGFFSYAIDDARATHAVWQKVLPRARALQAKHLPQPGQKCYAMYPDAPQRFGVLTEQIQVKGAIALQKVTYNGMRFDPDRAEALEAKTRKEVRKSTRWLRKAYPGLYTPDGKGGVKLQDKSQMPSLSQNYLKGALQALAHRYALEAPQSQGKLKGISVSVKEWREHAGLDPFFAHWISVGVNAKLLAFFDALKKAEDRVVRSNYKVLVRTGRTACSRINLQQLPKLDEFRALFVADPGHLLATFDYSAIELRTLAAVCKCRLGHSRLADVFTRPHGLDDPHAFTAAMILKVPFEEFLTWKGSKDPEKAAKYKKIRQNAKITNFGVPGGLSAEKLSRYAKFSYDLDMPVAEADLFRKKIVNEVYPELNEQNGYLASFSAQDLARNLGLPHSRVEALLQEKFGQRAEMFLLLLERVVKGVTETKKGKKYSASLVDRLWDFLNDLADEATALSDEAMEKVRLRKPSFNLASTLFGGTAVTLTGRVRARVGYTQKLNCLDAETEALTQRGWVKGFDLKMDDLLLTKNPDTGRLEWAHPTDLKFFPDFEGPLVEFRSNTFNAVSTPNHRWLVSDTKTGKVLCKTTEEISVTGGHGIHRTGDYAALSDRVYADDFVRLCGWFLTDGCCFMIPRVRVSDLPRVSLYQSERGNPGKVKEIDDLLARIGFLSCRVKQANGGVVWTLKTTMSHVLHDLFPERTLTTDFLTSLTKDQLHLLLETMMKGDGCRSSNRDTFCCGTRAKADAFQVLCSLIGKASKAVWRDMTGYSYTSSKMDNVPKMNGCWLVKILRRERAQVVKHQKKEFWSKQPLWCPIVPNTFFVARREGQVFVTGNTPFQSLAADGAKLGMWRLVRSGVMTRGMVHDELVNQFPAATAEEQAALAEKVLCEEMEKVLTRPGETKPIVPVKGEYKVAPRWEKP